MEFGELATKQDLVAFEKRIEALLNNSILEKIPKVVKSDVAKELLGGVSDEILVRLRAEKKLNPNKLGSIYIYNVEEIISLLPKYPKDDIHEATKEAGSKGVRKNSRRV